MTWWWCIFTLWRLTLLGVSDNPSGSANIRWFFMLETLPELADAEGWEEANRDPMDLTMASNASLLISFFCRGNTLPFLALNRSSAGGATVSLPWFSSATISPSLFGFAVYDVLSHSSNVKWGSFPQPTAISLGNLYCKADNGSGREACKSSLATCIQTYLVLRTRGSWRRS